MFVGGFNAVLASVIFVGLRDYQSEGIFYFIFGDDVIFVISQ